MKHLLEPDARALPDWLASHGLPRYRAAQIRRWVFAGRVRSFEEMSDLPKDLREKLAADFQLWTTRVALHTATDDGTEKLLLELADGQQIECVLLRDGPRRHQVGRASRAYVETHHDAHKIARDLVRIYEELIEKSKRR